MLARLSASSGSPGLARLMLSSNREYTAVAIRDYASKRTEPRDGYASNEGGICMVGSGREGRCAGIARHRFGNAAVSGSPPMLGI